MQQFKKLANAESLSIANKRVSNILAKYAETISTHQVNEKLFEHPTEQQLIKQLNDKHA